MPYNPKFMRETRRSYPDYAPAHWFSSREGSSIFVSAYKSLLVDQRDFVALKPLEIFSALAYPHTGKLTYQMAFMSRPVYGLAGEQSVQALNSGPITTPEGHYFLLIAPYDVAGVQGNEHKTREKLKSVRGFLQTFYGRNVAYEKVFDGIFNMFDNNSTYTSNAVENPGFFGPPHIDVSRRRSAHSAETHLAALPEATQARIALALRWIEDATTLSGVDAFLRTWFAIETLAMDGIKIRPVEEALQQIYSLPYDEVKSKFKVGLIADLRARIVHKGQVVPIHGLLESYVRAIFNDLLHHFLEKEGFYEAEKALGAPEFDFEATLHRS